MTGPDMLPVSLSVTVTVGPRRCVDITVTRNFRLTPTESEGPAASSENSSTQQFELGRVIQAWSRFLSNRTSSISGCTVSSCWPSELGGWDNLNRCCRENGARPFLRHWRHCNAVTAHWRVSGTTLPARGAPDSGSPADSESARDTEQHSRLLSGLGCQILESRDGRLGLSYVMLLLSPKSSSEGAIMHDLGVGGDDNPK